MQLERAGFAAAENRGGKTAGGKLGSKTVRLTAADDAILKVSCPARTLGNCRGAAAGAEPTGSDGAAGREGASLWVAPAHSVGWPLRAYGDVVALLGEYSVENPVAKRRLR